MRGISRLGISAQDLESNNMTIHNTNSKGKPKMKQCKQAFTLIELLVVICIIAILASMLLPALQSARDSASTATCVSNLGQMAKAFQMYATSFNDFMPALTGTQGNGGCSWENALADAIGQGGSNSSFRKVYFCDADSSSDNPGANKKSYSLNNLKHAVHPVIGFTLGSNGTLNNVSTGEGYISGNKTTAVFAASSLITIGENVSPSNSIGTATFSSSNIDSPGSASAVHQQVAIKKYRYTSHNTAGELYLDGHVKHMKPQLTYPKKGEKGVSSTINDVAIAVKTSYGDTSPSKGATEGFGDWSDCPKRKLGDNSCKGESDSNGKNCHSRK